MLKPITGACPDHLVAGIRDDLSERTLLRRIQRKMGQAIADFQLIEQGDRILVALSGGKDSYTLLEMLEGFRRKAPVSFSLLSVNIDQGFEGYQWQTVRDFVESRGMAFHRHATDIAGLLKAKLGPDESMCPLCSRLRRGALYQLAPKLGCNKIALGHHADDLIETLLLNLFFTGQLKSMPPKLHSDDGRNIVIRPLAYVSEAEIAGLAGKRQFPIVCCCCPACGTKDNQQRRALKEMLAQMEQAHPGLKSSALTALKNVAVSHLLDRNYLPD